jgi:hypothetical protein
MLMALVAAFNLEVIQLDAINAFVNAQLDEEIYIACPDGFKTPGYCYKLRRALYGLRKSPKLWFLELSTTLKELGLIPVPDEQCLYIHPNKPILVFFYVDDILIIGHLSNQQDLQAITTRLNTSY